MTHPRAGQPAQAEDLVDVDALIGAYYDRHPDVDDPDQQVAFGTSGHRGSSLRTAFNEDHILATTQAIVDYRVSQGFDGPLFIGRDTHGLSEPAWRSALEVLVANGVQVLVDDRDGFTPTPAVSHAILRANRGKASGARGLADGIVVTPSHNPPADGGFKYNPPARRPGRHRRDVRHRRRAPTTSSAAGSRTSGASPSSRPAREAGSYDFMGTYVDDLPHVVDLARIREAGVRIGADPLGGASVAYWGEIGERHGLDLTVVNPRVDPQWAFMTLDWDGKIRMDCSSPSAMASLIRAKDAYDISTGNDADADRHGIVTPDAGLMNPNHYLAVAIQYLYGGARPGWPATTAIGKTLVSSSMIDRVASDLGRTLLEVPVGFKWFVPGLLDGSVGLRRRGVRRSQLPAPGRHGLVDRQGRHPARPAGLRDPRRDGQDTQPALRRADRATRRPGIRPHRRGSVARGEGQARARSPPTTSPPRPLRESRSRASSPRPRATAPRSAASR